MNTRLSNLLKEFDRFRENLREAIDSIDSIDSTDSNQVEVPPCRACKRCKGTGSIKLPKHLKKVLRCVRDHPECTTEQIRSILDEGITMNGISNRLSDLVDLKLVTRRRSGKFFHYSLAK